MSIVEGGREVGDHRHAGYSSREVNSPARRAAEPLLVMVTSIAMGVASLHVDAALLLGAAIMVVLVVLAVRAPRIVVITTLLLLPFVGILRRISGSYHASVDPLAFAGPALALICLLVMSFRKNSRPRTSLAISVSAMVGLGLIQILNPAQGGLSAGLLGAGLFVGPLVWFYVGHRVGDAVTLEAVIRTLRIVVIIVAAYGGKQLLLGFTGFEQAWVQAKEAEYVALNISGRTRPFSTFSSGVEYSYFLALGATLFAINTASKRQALRIGVVLVLLAACFFAGSRTVFVASLLSVVVVVLVQRIQSLSKALIWCVAIVISGLLLLRLVPLSADETTAGAIQNRTLEGLTRPFDRESSTLGIHLDAFGRGLAQGLTNPIGSGAASVNLAGVTAGRPTVSAEHDIPNMFLAYGWAGGAIFMVLIASVYRTLRKAVRHSRRNLLGPGVFVLATFGVWFSGQLYAVSAILWFFIGAIDRLNSELTVPERHAEMSGTA